MFNVIDSYSSLEPPANDATYTKQFETAQHDNFNSSMDNIITKLSEQFNEVPLKVIKHVLFFFYIFLKDKANSARKSIILDQAYNKFILNSVVKELEDELDVKFEFEINDQKVSNEILIILHFMTVPKSYIDIVSYTIKKMDKSKVVFLGSEPSSIPNSFMDKYTNEEIKVIKEFIKVKPTDTICDPFNMYNTLLLELNNNNMLYGYCINETFELISKLNFYIYTNFYKKEVKYSTIKTLHSLKENMDLLEYDIIITKMPKEQNMKHAECCERVNKLKIRGTKCEPLYLQLLMTSLKSGGLCAVIVPKSLLISDSSCHIETRKYLLKNFELKNIIEMNRTYIIYFENSGRTTTSYTIKSGYYTDEMFLPGRQIWPVNPNSVKPGTKIIDVKDLENTTYNLLEIKKIEEVKKEDELVCYICGKCIEKDKIIEELKTKLKAIRELSTISNKN